MGDGGTVARDGAGAAPRPRSRARPRSAPGARPAAHRRRAGGEALQDRADEPEPAQVALHGSAAPACCTFTATSSPSSCGPGGPGRAKRGRTALRRSRRTARPCGPRGRARSPSYPVERARLVGRPGAGGSANSPAGASTESSCRSSGPAPFSRPSCAPKSSARASAVRPRAREVKGGGGGGGGGKKRGGGCYGHRCATAFPSGRRRPPPAPSSR